MTVKTPTAASVISAEVDIDDVLARGANPSQNGA
jgi:hypothetical protein